MYSFPFSGLDKTRLLLHLCYKKKNHVDIDCQNVIYVQVQNNDMNRNVKIQKIAFGTTVPQLSMQKSYKCSDHVPFSIPGMSLAFLEHNRG
jgi:hypothetical protein